MSGRPAQIDDIRLFKSVQPECANNPELFESEDLAEHMEAKKVCDACPLIAACQKNLENTIRIWGYDRNCGPRGTWAGTLYSPPPPKTMKGPVNCGKSWSAREHRRRHEPVCETCKAAERDHKAAKRKAAA
jgi:hypothetical protein